MFRLNVVMQATVRSLVVIFSFKQFGDFFLDNKRYVFLTLQQKVLTPNKPV